LSIIPPLASIPVGVVVERSKGAGPWTDFLWRAVGALSGVPDTPAWSKLSDDGERATFYAGAAAIELYRSETSNYRENLATETPLLWVALRPTAADPPYALAGVTADPAEGEGWAGVGNDIVDSVAMPDAILQAVADFVAQHHVEHAFSKRKRDRADPEALARRAAARDGGKP
jgi:hypothetical protein